MSERGYLAVVHADGDGLGARGIDLLKGIEAFGDYVEKSRKWSEAVEKIATSALQTTLSELIARIEQDSRGEDYRTIVGDGPGERAVELTLVEEERRVQGSREVAPTGRYYLPFRPIVFGGRRRDVRGGRPAGPFAGRELPKAFCRRSREETSRLRSNIRRQVRR